MRNRAQQPGIGNHSAAQIDPLLPASNDGNGLAVLTKELLTLVSGTSQELHLEQEQTLCRIRCRINGTLTESKYPSGSLLVEILSELQIEFDKPFSRRKVRIRVAAEIHTLELRFCETAYGQSLSLVPCEIRVPGTLDQTNMLPYDVDTLRTLLHSGPRGLTLYTCNDRFTLNQIYYAMLGESSHVEHKIVSIESSAISNIPRISQFEMAGNIDSPSRVVHCTKFADRVFVNIEDDPTLEDQIIFALLDAKRSANIFITSDTAAHALHHLTNKKLFNSRLLSYFQAVVELRPAPLICPHCADFHTLSTRETQWLLENTQIDGEYPEQSFNTANGCERCHYTGCNKSITLLSCCKIDEELINTISEKPLSKVYDAIQSISGERSIHHQLEVLARGGNIRFEDYLRS